MATMFNVTIHSEISEFPVEKRYDAGVKISELKKKFELITGVNHSTMKIYLSIGDKEIGELADDDQTLGHYAGGQATGETLKLTVRDSQPSKLLSGDAPKFQLSEEEYSQKLTKARNLLVSLGNHTSEVDLISFIDDKSTDEQKSKSQATTSIPTVELGAKKPLISLSPLQSRLFDKMAKMIPPIGMMSGKPSQSFNTTDINKDANKTDPSLSPSKEKHQATLISSSATCGSTGTTINSPFQADSFRDSVSILNGSKSTASFASTANSSEISPTSVNLINQTISAGEEFQRSNFKLQPQFRLPHLNNNSSQTAQSATRRTPQLTITNLSLEEDQRHTQSHPQHHRAQDSNKSLNDNGDHFRNQEEPVVCWHPYAQSEDAQTRAASPHCCNPSSYASSISSDSDSSSDSVSFDPNHVFNPDITMAIAKDGLNVMKVQRATVFHNDKKGDYKMKSKPRGPCLIVNNVNFEADIFPTRKGSDEDAKRFDEIFQQLDFSVIMKRDLTADQMRAVFKEVAAGCKPEHNALFVFILSHGSDDRIYGTDGMEVCLHTEVLPYFNNRNCGAMKGKPKVFVIQACRGPSKDYGSDADALDSIAVPPIMARAASGSVLTQSTSQENRTPESSWPQQASLDSKKRNYPEMTDMLMVFSCLAGFVSVRNELTGSWLGTALAFYILKYAHEKNFFEILMLVSKDVMNRKSSHGHLQSPELRYFGWTKNLYFNPGYPG